MEIMIDTHVLPGSRMDFSQWTVILVNRLLMIWQRRLCHPMALMSLSDDASWFSRLNWYAYVSRTGTV